MTPRKTTPPGGDRPLGNNRPLGFVIEETPGQPVFANGSVIAIGNTL